MPHYFILENVTALQDGDAKSNNANMVAKMLRGLGYKVLVLIQSASSYALPQRRERILFIGERISKKGDSILCALEDLLKSIAASATIPITKFLSHTHRHSTNLKKRKYTSVDVGAKWVGVNSKFYKEQNFPWKKNWAKPLDLPAWCRPFICESFWDLQARQKSNALYCFSFFSKPNVRKDFNLTGDSIVLADLNCSLPWCVGSVGILESPCVTTKSIICVVHPYVEVLDLRVSANLMGMDADAMPNMGVVARRHLTTMIGDSFVLPMIGYVMYGIVTLARVLPKSREESDLLSQE